MRQVKPKQAPNEMLRFTQRDRIAAASSGRRARATVITVMLAAAFAVVDLVRAQPGPALVSVGPVVEREAVEEKQFVATIMPRRVSVVGSAVEGRVEELPVEEGDAVRKGQPLARLRTRTIEVEVAAARAELDLRKQELAELENGSRLEEIAVAQAAMLAAKARREYAQKDWARIQRLFEESSAASDEFDEALSRADETEQEFLKDQATYEMTVAGPRKERIEQARARMEQQRHEVERLEDILSKYTVVAPFDGYVTSKRTEVGAWVTDGDVVAEVVELAQVDVEALIPEDYVHRLRIGMSGTVRVPSLASEEFTGTVAAIVPQADMRSRSFPVKVRVDNPVAGGSPKLKSGMFAEVKLAIGEPKPVLLVSKDAIVLGGPSPIVYVLEPSENDPLTGTVRDVPVTLGLSVEAMIEVKGELRAGQQVVTVGNERLSPGRPVRIATTALTPAAAPRGETAEATRPAGP